MASDYLERTNYLSLMTGAFSEWGIYLKLAIPSALILCAEWWMYEALTLFAGWLGTIYLATIIIIFNIHNLVYDISYGLSQAASSQIGRTLAEIGKRTAKRLLKFIVSFQIFICIMVSLGYLVCTRGIIKLYTNEEDIVELFVDCKYLIILMFVLDSSQIVLGGIIRGIGEQGESSIVSFVSYALITLPLSIFFSFYCDMKLQGILLAYICGIIFNAIFNTVILLKSDWELLIRSDDDDKQVDYEEKFADYTKITH
jgi:multidrug resistance protein, MATE family